MKLTLTPKLALVFILFAGLLLVGVGTLAYDSGQTALKEAAVTELEATSLEKEAALESWIQEREARMIALSRSPYILAEVEALVEAVPESSAARERLIRELSVRTGKGQSFLNVIIIQPGDGQVIVSVDPNEDGDFRMARPYFQEGMEASYTTPIYFSTELQAPAMAIAAPIRSADGRVIAVLAGRLNLEELNSIIQRRTGLRQTDDAFLVNTSHLFVTQPRFLPDPVILQEGIHTVPVTLCLHGSTGTISAVDYRNVPVIATYRWLPERQMCLIVKISQEEALAPIRQFEKNVVLIGLVVMAAASILALGLSHSMIGPIRDMRTAAQRYGRGDLDVRLPETRHDELGTLAHEFNQMAASLAEKERELLEHAHNLEQKVVERTRSLLEKEYLLSESQRIAHIGSWQYEPAHERLIWSDETHRICGTQPESFSPSVEALIGLLHPEDRPRMAGWMNDCMAGQRPSGIEFRVVLPDASHRVVYGQGELLPANGERPIRLIGTVLDITERKRAELALQHTADDLFRSNAELEQFAYVASHDLQEPLRMVSSYVQLLARRYQDQLDADADEFIAYAVDGAKRMQNLINDLLAYSRVGTRGNEFSPISFEFLLDDVLTCLQLTIEESGATITHDPLPVVKGDSIQLSMVFQNLLINSIKFRSNEPPCIHIGVRRDPQEWVFSVRDNGIGIDPKFSERIFVIFQRLHNRESYSGTGIGLAVCKRVIQRHDGRIWVESEPSKGSVFYFTLPAGSENL